MKDQQKTGSSYQSPVIIVLLIILFDNPLK